MCTTDQKIDTAKKIVDAIATKMQVKVEDIISGRHFTDVAYTRRLAVYFIRNFTGLPHKTVAALVGFKRQGNSIDEYRRVRSQYKTDIDVKSDVIVFEKIINQLAA